MLSNYGLLVLFRVVTAAVNLLVIRQLNIPLDLIAMVVGLWVLRPWVRATIFSLEVLNLMGALLGLFFGNYAGSLFGVAVYGLCIYVLCKPELKERFM